MLNGLKAEHVKQINVLVNSVSKRIHRKKELQQLTELFCDNFIGRLKQILSTALNPAKGSSSEELDFQLGWIDKIPLASVASQFQEKVELGDVVVLAFKHSYEARTQRLYNSRACALILQAKVTNDERQLTNPTVPVTPLKGSTLRELALLSSWPKFDLYATARSKVPLVNDIHLKTNSTSIPPYGWYIVAPNITGLRPSLGTQWPSWWMAGAAKKGNCCDISFGALLVHFLKETPITTDGTTVPVGHEFTWRGKLPSVLTGTDWTRLCHEIIKLLPTYCLPPSLFPKHQNSGRVRGFTIFRKRILQYWDYISFFLGTTFSLRKSHRVPVLIVSIIQRE
jgi:hypothetical protein